MYPYSYPFFYASNGSLPDSEFKSIINFLLKDIVEKTPLVEVLLTNISRAADWDRTVDDPLIANIEIILGSNATTTSFFEVGQCVVL